MAVCLPNPHWQQPHLCSAESQYHGGQTQSLLLIFHKTLDCANRRETGAGKVSKRSGSL